MMNVYLSRSVRGQRYKLICNPHPEFAFTTHIDLLLRDTSGDYFREWTQLAETDPQAARVVASFHGRPEYELYDLLDDPEEMKNRADDPELQQPRRQLLSQLKAWMKDQGDELTVFHKPLMLDAPETWVARNPRRAAKNKSN
jgi:uncharacterized sulfatase